MYKKILVPLDGSDLAECVLSHVEDISKGCGVEEVILLKVNEPHLVQVRENPPFEFRDYLQATVIREEAEASQYLAEIEKHLRDQGVNARSEVLGGNPAEVVVNYAERNDVDLVTIATHGRSGISRWVYGSVADRILRSISKPVLMVRAPGAEKGI